MTACSQALMIGVLHVATIATNLHIYTHIENARARVRVQF